jgi:ATP-dependent exoDNAse (exonuclease V) beta subunit
MRPEDGLQPPFEDLEATGPRVGSPGFNHPPWSAVEHWVEWPPGPDGVPTAKKQKQGAVNAHEAEAIAADIRRIHDETGADWGEFAVLLRATTAQNVLLEAFRRWGVRFEVAREREFYRQREIIEAAALVRAIIEPTDALALLTVLRSDVVGVPDAALAPLWDAGLPAAAAALDGPGAPALTGIRGIAAVASGLDLEVPGVDKVPDWADAVVGAMEILAELRRSMRDDPPDVFVERLRTLWLAEVTAAARDLGRFRRARLDAFLHDLEDTLVRGADGGASLARFLRRSVEEGREAASTAEPDRRSDAVHVMTIYGAKGLDFDHVYLAQTHKRTGGSGAPPTAVLRRFKGRPELKLFAWKSPGFELAERRRNLQAAAEKVRLLYVAMTRARQRLVVSGCWPEPGAIIEPLRASTLADLVAHRGDPALIHDLIEEGTSRQPDPKPCVGWYLPALEKPSSPPETSGAGAGAVASDATVAEDARAIAEARAAAAARMAAPWSRAASAAAHRLVERRESEIEDPRSRGSHRPGVAAVVGTAVHRLLEELDLDRGLGPQIVQRRTRLEEAVCARLEPDLRRSGVETLGAVLNGLAAGRCLGRLAEIADEIVARELDVLLRPAAADGTSVVTGAVDLVYTDPEDGRLVVADYKTDAVETEAEIAERVERYQPQLAVYARALEEALALEYRPRAELWFLQADRIVRLS